MPNFTYPTDLLSQDIAAPLLPDAAQALLRNSEGVLLRIPGEAPWLLPITPNITISGKQQITRRLVFKKHPGTLKERTTQDDYTITISGFLGGKTHYPIAEIRLLKRYFEYNKPVEVIAAPLIAMDIYRIAFSDFQLPPTQGDSSQRYLLQGYSDTQDYSLFE